MDGPFNPNKILRFPEAISEWMRTGFTTAPITLDMDLTNRCRHRCPQCNGEREAQADAELSKSEAIDYLRQFAELGTKSVIFAGGGDPLCHSDCATIVEAASAFGLHTAIETNGSGLSDSDAVRIKTTTEWIRISLDACNAEAYSQTHGVSVKEFAHVCERIAYLSKAVGKAVIGVGVLTDARNSADIIHSAELVKSLGADYIYFRPYNNDFANVSNAIRSAKDSLGDATFSVFAAWSKYDCMREGYAKPYDVCRFHHFNTVINASAELHFCCDMHYGRGLIGSLRKSTAKDLWLNHVRRNELETGVDLSKCPALCRANMHNVILHGIAKDIQHEVFL